MSTSWNIFSNFKALLLQFQTVSMLTSQTTKERHMWKCKLIEGEHVKLVFRIPVNQVSRDKISKIALWNYNKSLYVSIRILYSDQCTK